jgi:hypothetical protein
MPDFTKKKREIIKTIVTYLNLTIMGHKKCALQELVCSGCENSKTNSGLF